MKKHTCNSGSLPSVDLIPLTSGDQFDPLAPPVPNRSSASSVVCDLLRAPGQRISPIGTAQNNSMEVCWLLRANHEHPNLNLLEEEDWKSLLATVEVELRRE